MTETSPPLSAERDAHDLQRRRIWREGMTMVLYVAIVLLGTLAVLAAGGDDGGDPIDGPVGAELIAVIWGTTMGLTLAHLFAFHVATHGIGGGHLRGHDFQEGVAQLAGAAFVASAASVPVLLFRDDIEQDVVPFVLALVIGGSDYVIERVNGRGLVRSIVYGVVTLLLAIAVAAIKLAISDH